MSAFKTCLNLVGGLVLISTAAVAQDFPRQELAVMGGSGGTAFSRSCPVGSVLTGVRARVGLAIDAIGIKCRAVQANGSLGSESNVGTMVGGSGGSSFSGSCPVGSVIRSQMGTDDGVTIISYLTLGCYAWSASTRTVGSVQTKDIRVFTPAVHGLFAPSFCLRDAQPARAIQGRAGSLVDAFGLICNEP